jgi:O-antigen ligase
MLYVSSKPMGAWFQGAGATPDASPLDRIFLIFLLFLSLGILIRRGFDWPDALGANAWAMVLIVFMLISVLWSHIPFTSLIRWIREIQALLMAFVVLSEPAPRRAMESLIRRSVYILIPFSIFLVKYMPEYGRIYSYYTGGETWVGVALQKNGLGRLCLIALIFLFWSLATKWRERKSAVGKRQLYLELGLIVMAVWLMKGPGRGAYSATSVGSLILGVLVYCGLSLRKKRGQSIKAFTLMIGALSIIILGILTVFTNASAIGSLAPTFGRDETLTERTVIWKTILPLAMERPLIGKGFGGFYTAKTRRIIEASEAHNGYLDVLLELGFAGIAIVSLFILSACRKAQREIAGRFHWGALWICFIMILLVHNIVESSINSLTSPLMAINLFFMVSASSSEEKFNSAISKKDGDEYNP